MASNLAEFCSSVLGKVECNEFRYLVEKISIQKEPKLQDLENSYPIHIEKKMIKHVAVQSFHKKIIHDVISHLNRSQEQEMGLYQQRYCQFRPKGIEKVLHKGRLSGSAKILQNRTIELSSCFYRIEQ